MTPKAKIVITLAVLLAAFAAGRYSVQTPKTVATEDIKKEDQTDKNTHTVTTTTKKVHKDGEEETVITVVKDTNLSTKNTVTDDKRVEVTPAKKNTINVSALIGIDIGTISKPVPIYGVSVNKELLGPVTGGLFGLTNGTLGVSIGLNF